jgi:WD40 repeat protein
VGETGYTPRVLIFSLQDTSSDIPLVSISEHTFGVTAVAWSPDGKYLASLGTANDGFLYLWKIDPKTGAAKLFQQNRCTSFIKGMFWMGNSLVTLGVRHVKVWKVEEELPRISPTKVKFPSELSYPQPQTQRALPGRNILLGPLLEACFSCAVAIDEKQAVICSENGDICLLDQHMKLTKVHEMGFYVHCVSLRQSHVYVGGKGGQFAVLSLDAILQGADNKVLKVAEDSSGILAMGFLEERLVTIDDKHSVDIWGPDFVPSKSNGEITRIPIPGHGEAIVGIHAFCGQGSTESFFYTWSASGRVTLWDAEGMAKSSFSVPVEQLDADDESVPVNELVIVRATKGGKQFVAGDKLGVLRVIDGATLECKTEIKAHSSDCQDIALYEDDTKTLMATCGRDRTAQLFHKYSEGAFELVQTLEFAARVVQVLVPSSDKLVTCSLDRTLQIFDLVAKEGDPNVMAAIPSRLISLKASPSSMVMSLDGSSIYVSLVDRSICQFDMDTGRLANAFKCIDEAGSDAVVIDSLIYGQVPPHDTRFLLGLSNTDKSVRIYDSLTGAFLDREWGHTEAINGVVLLDDGAMRKKIVSVGSDGTIMMWALDLQESFLGSSKRDPSPEKTGSINRPPLRRVLSKAELAEFQRSSPSPGGRRSPPRLQRRASRYGLSSTASVRTPAHLMPASPLVPEGTPSRRRPSDDGQSSGSRSPPLSPKARSRLSRRPSLPAINNTTPAQNPLKKKSASNLRASYGFGSLNVATEQTCRQLRAFRKKLSSTDPINADVLAELDAELRLTAAALGDRAIRTRSSAGRKQSVSETVLSGLLDEYSDRLVSMLDAKLRLRLDDEKEEAKPQSKIDTENSQLGLDGENDEAKTDGLATDRTDAGESEGGSSITLGEGSS